MLKIDLEKMKQIKLSQLKANISPLLSETDYIVVKIAEALALNNYTEADALKQKYSAKLQQRERIRDKAEQIKQAIRNAKSVEELNRINLNIE